MIEQLTEIIKPPIQTVSSFSLSDFDDIEKKLQIIFPLDFKELIIAYGSGTFGDFIDVLNPLKFNNSESEYSFTEQRIRKTYLEMRSEFPHHHPFEYYPKEYGILPWGTTQNGDELFWYIVDKNPDKWQIIVWQSRSVNYYLYPCDLTTFLTKIFTNGIDCPAFGYLVDKKTFSPTN
jgi:hypothetical protein